MTDGMLRTIAVIAAVFLVAGCAYNPAKPPCGRARAAYVAAVAPSVMAVTSTPREWWIVCKDAYRERGWAWLILFPLGAIAPITCGAVFTFVYTAILPVFVLPFGVVSGVVSVPFAVVSPDGWCNFPDGTLSNGWHFPSNQRCLLGVQVENLEPDPTSPYSVRPVKIIRVVEGSPADRAKLEVEDRIISVSTTTEPSPVPFWAALSSLKPGDRITLHVLRNDSFFDVEVELRDWPLDCG